MNKVRAVHDFSHVCITVEKQIEEAGYVLLLYHSAKHHISLLVPVDCGNVLFDVYVLSDHYCMQLLKT